MLQKFSNRLLDDKKVFSIVFIIILLIIIAGIVSPILTNWTKNNWENDLAGKINDIQDGTLSMFEKKQTALVNKSDLFVKSIKYVYGDKDSLPPKTFSKILTSDFYSGYSVGIYNRNLHLVAWTENYNIADFDSNYQKIKYNETFFYNYNLSSYLFKADSVQIGRQTYYIVFAQLIEKHFSIDNDLFKKVSFSDVLENKFATDFDIDYFPERGVKNDAKRYSFDLNNNKHNKIGLVTFTKPALTASLSNFTDKIDLFQSILVALAGIIIGFGFRKDYFSIKYKSLRFLLLLIYLTFLRILFFQTGFPSNILGGEIINPNNFSSAFGFGIVKSPVELFITALFVLIIAVKIYQYYLEYASENKAAKVPSPYSYIIVFVMTCGFLLSIRGLAAIIKSVVLDSTLRYFKNPDLIPDSASLLMNLNVLICGFTILIVLILLALIAIRTLFADERLTKKNFLYGVVILLFANLFFVLVQRSPLINYYLAFFIVIIISIMIYHIYYIKTYSVYNFIYIAIAASVISITLLSYFNSGLEKESLKTIALELNRPNESMLRFYIEKTLTEASNDQYVKDFCFEKKENMNAPAFNIWSCSPLQKESADYFVYILDQNKKPVGYFSKSLKNKNQIDPIVYSFTDRRLRIYESGGEDDKKIITGITPIISGNEILCYVAVSVYYNGSKIHSEYVPDYLATTKNVFNDVLNSNELNIFTFRNKKLVDSYGGLALSQNMIGQITSAEISESNEGWLALNINGESYKFYVLKNNTPTGEMLTAVALREKQISLNLYNFFKLFLIHSIYIIALLVVVFFTQLKKPYGFRLSFRAQLLTAFLFMSLIPILSLAIYNRHFVAEKSKTEIQNELREKANYVENSFRVYSAQLDTLPADTVKMLFDKISNEQNINFSAFEGEKEFFSSVDELTSIGILPRILSPKVNNRLNNSGLREYFNQEQVDNYDYLSFYKKIIVNNNEYTLNVNSAVNKINSAISSLDIDIFLFGVYSFATIIIIIIGTVLANKISSPIRRLTKATSSVAHGDFNIEIETKERGEIKDLINGFNFMTRELNKRQMELAELERETAWKEMARQVAHEIKNPLTPMKLAVQQLVIAFKDNHASFSSIFEKVTNTVLNQIDNLNTIASEFSNFARMPIYKLEELDVIPVIADTINLFMDENIDIKLSPKVSSALIEGDVSQIRRIFINLIRNSIQANATVLNIEVEEIENRYAITIKDNGAGIPEKIQEKIFDKNFTTKIKGMGIGLKLAKKFIDSISGRIYLKNSSADGSEFVIEFNKKTTA
jgi:two-component system, NtrC family, nitrogen regulation sensor histidine kinase NtrY